jgi:hypothetical protein
MQNKEVTVTTLAENMEQNITMESGGIELDGVEIVREMPVSIKGDTITIQIRLKQAKSASLKMCLKTAWV